MGVVVKLPKIQVKTSETFYYGHVQDHDRAVVEKKKKLIDLCGGPDNLEKLLVSLNKRFQEKYGKANTEMREFQECLRVLTDVQQGYYYYDIMAGDVNERAEKNVMEELSKIKGYMK